MNHLGGGGACAENVLKLGPFLSSPVRSDPVYVEPITEFERFFW